MVSRHHAEENEPHDDPELEFPPNDKGETMMRLPPASYPPSAARSTNPSFAETRIPLLKTCQALRGKGRPVDPRLIAVERDFLAALDALARRGARRRGWSPADLDDAAQTVYLAVASGLPGHRHDPSRGTFGAWLATVADRTLANDERRRRRRDGCPFGDDQGASLPSTDSGPTDRLEGAERDWIIREALTEVGAALPEPFHELPRLHWFEGRSTREIAERFGVSEGKVWNRLHRIKPKLRAALERLGLKGGGVIGESSPWTRNSKN